MQECEEMLKEFQTVNTDWCLGFVAENVDQNATRYTEKVDEWRRRAGDLKQQVDQWRYVSATYKPGIREYVFDMGDALKAKKDDDDDGKARFQSAPMAKIAIRSGLEAVSAVTSVSVQPGSMLFRVEFRSTEKYEAAMAKLEEELSRSGFNQESHARRLAELKQRIDSTTDADEKKTLQQELLLQQLISRGQDRLQDRSSVPTMRLAELSDKLTELAGAAPARTTECADFAGDARVDAAFEAQVHIKIDHIIALLDELQTPDEAFLNLFEATRTWEQKINAEREGLARANASTGLSHLARQYEAAIVDLNRIMESDAFVTLRSGSSTSLATLGSQTTTVVSRAIFTDANRLVAHLHSSHEAMDESVREKNFIGPLYKELQTHSDEMSHQLLDSEDRFWGGSTLASRLCKVGLKGEEERQICKEIRDHVSAMDEDMIPLNEALEKIGAPQSVSNLEHSILASARLVVAKHSEHGWTTKKWDDPNGKDVVLQLCLSIRVTKEGYNQMLVEIPDVLQKNWEPKKKADIDYCAKAARDVSRMFAFLNDALDTHQTSLYSHGRMRSVTVLEANILEEARKIRDTLYHLYDKIKGIAKSGPLPIGRETLSALWKQYNGSNLAANSSIRLLSPPFFDTRDDPTGLMQKSQGTKEGANFTVPFRREFTAVQGKGTTKRMYDLETKEEVPISVQCDVAATAIVALSLLLYPQKRDLSVDVTLKKKNSTQRLAESGKQKMRKKNIHYQNEDYTPYIFHVDQKGSDLLSVYRETTWEAPPNPKKYPKWMEKLAEWWKQSSREDLERVWKNVWLESINPVKDFSHVSIDIRTSAWTALKRGFPDVQQRREHGHLFDLYTKELNGRAPPVVLSPSKCREIFYKDLKEKGVWMFKRDGGKQRVDMAVKHMVRVVRRIHDEYQYTAVDYLRLLSHRQKSVSMIYDFLFDMVGDAIEEKIGDPRVFSSARTAEEMVKGTAAGGRGGGEVGQVGSSRARPPSE
jgi:hypothetical protein